MGNLDSSQINVNAHLSLKCFFKLRYEEDAFISNVYDLETMTAVNNIPLIMNKMRESKTFFYHASTACNIISILRDGFKFQQDVQKLNVKTRDQYLGSGIYFAEYIEKSLQYGNFIFVAELNIVEPYLVIPHMDHMSFSKYRAKHFPEINSYECVIYKGKYNRAGSRNKNFGFYFARIKDFYNEVRIRNLDNIKLKYVIELERLHDAKLYRKIELAKMEALSIFREINSIIDVFDQKFYDSIDFPKTGKKFDGLFRSNVSFNDVLKYLQSRLVKSKNLREKCIATKNIYVPVQFAVQDICNTSSRYVMVGELFKNNVKLDDFDRNDGSIKMLIHYFIVFD